VAFFGGCLLAAGGIGLAADSGVVFTISSPVLLIGNLLLDEIRFNQRDR
jgi:hypothetical protein